KKTSLRAPEIQAPTGPGTVDSLIAHNQPDPRANDRRVGQIDIFSNQPFRSVASRIDEPFARSVIPVEAEIDALAGCFQLGGALFPFVLGIARDRRIGTTIPSAGPVSFDRVFRAAITR